MEHPVADQAEVREEVLNVWGGRVQIRVKVKGAGSPVVYFHPAAGLSWDPFLDRLAEHHTVYAPEHPGMSAEDPHAIHMVDTYWDLLLIYEEVMRGLALDRPAAIGQSYGGMIACDLAAHFPGLFSKLVPLDPIGLWRDDAPVRLAEFIVSPPQKFPEFLFFEPEGEAARAMFALPEDPEIMAKAVAGIVWALGCTGKFTWPVPDTGLAKRLHRVTVPTLIVWGKQDALVPVIYAEEFGRRIANSRVEVIDRCGHIPQMEQMETTYELVSEFLSS
jgi:pimeloyl-ACP methyl ester carboxylesterase